MRDKQTGGMQPAIIITILASAFVMCLGTIFFVDKATTANNERLRAQVTLGSKYNSSSRQNADRTVRFDLLQTAKDNPLSLARKASSLTSKDINMSNAREALNSASGKDIQSAISEKTGRSVSLSKIEGARTKALSSKGQRAISKAMTRRGEIDKVRSKLNNF